MSETTVLIRDGRNPCKCDPRAWARIDDVQPGLTVELSSGQDIVTVEVATLPVGLW